MKRLNKRIGLYISLIALAIVSSCTPSFDDFDSRSSGQPQADFSKFIAVGNSLTAGFADGGLYLEGQKNAFPNIIAEHMKVVGGGSFNVPFFDAEHANGSGYIRLKDLVNGNPVMENVTDNLAYREAGKLIKYTGEINNLGVPGMRLDHSGVAPVSALNMYFERLLPDSEVGTKSYIDFASNRNHTFFSFWLGNNDALGYATNGAVDEENGTTNLTTTAVFTAMYTNFITVLTENNQKGVVATIPDVTAVPFFTTVTRAALLNAASAAAGTTLTDLYIETKSGIRPATDNDMFVLPFSSAGLLGVPNDLGAPYGLHPENPIEDKYVLDENEAKEVQDRVNEFNAVIKQTAESKNLALADVHEFLNMLRNNPNYMVNGVRIGSGFITGNAFSLDGIHLTPMGNAVVANLFIEAINKKYNTDIPKADITKYRAVIMP